MKNAKTSFLILQNFTTTIRKIDPFTSVKNIKKTLVLPILVVALFFPSSANSGYVDVTEKTIKTRFYGNGVVFSVDSGKNYNRFGAGYGYRNKEYELHLGLHDNLFPYVDFSYRLEHIKTMLNAYVQSEDVETKPKVRFGIGATYLLSEDFGLHVNLERETWAFGVRKWF